jgi:hypothetical protein
LAGEPSHEGPEPVVVIIDVLGGQDPVQLVGDVHAVPDRDLGDELITP